MNEGSNNNSLGGAMKEIGAFFARSSKIHRTPPTESKSGPEAVASSTQVIAGTPVARPTMDGEKCDAGDADDAKLIEALGIAKDLHEFAKDRNNVHKDIKKMAVKLVAVLSAYQRERAATEPIEVGRKGKAVEMGATRKEGSVDPIPTPTGTAKRSRAIRSPEEEVEGIKKAKSEGESAPTVEEWKTQGSRKKKKNVVPEAKKERNCGVVRHRSDAILVDAEGEMSYANILRRVKCDPELKSLGESVYRVRRTQKNELLIELKRGVCATDLTCQEALKKSVGDAGQVKLLSQSETIECRNLDEVTSAQEVEQAIQSQLGLEAQMVVKMRAAYGGMQKATIKMGADLAAKILAVGKIRVGWTVCPLRLVPKPKQCFKCWGVGHQQWSCKGPDRSDTCMRCGEVGHRARGCSKEQKCVLCPADRCNHRMGGPDCKARW